jgi:hypothetical protein
VILRRMINSLRSQNWVGLSLELIVLVAGVFLGLQVDDWNENRKQLIEEQRLVGYLVTDVENTISHLNHVIDIYEYEASSGRRVIELLAGESLANEDIEDFETGLYQVGKVLSLDVFLVSFQPVNLEQIQNPKLRRILDNYVAEIRVDNGVSRHVRERINGALVLIGSRAYVGPESDVGRLAVYDFDRLRQDYNFRAAFATSTGMIEEHTERIQDLLARTAELLSTLQSYQSGEGPLEASP